MENKILAKYYEGILNQLRGEVDFINEVFQHQGLKGEGNEAAIRNLLEKFIPRKYGVGSGIVIDQEGTPSKQCDIVIYDNHSYPEILSLSSIHIYPVDFVYATIEVKTTLDAGKARESVENIKSVRGLNYLKHRFRSWPTDPLTEDIPSTVMFVDTATTPPLGITFGYRSKTSNYDTFAGWFRKSEDEDTTYWPSHVFCLDQGVIVAPGEMQRTCWAFPLVSGEMCFTAEQNQIKMINEKEWAEHSGRLFPLTKIKEDKLLVDQSKILIQFLMVLSELLGKKHLSPNISLLKSYLTGDLAAIFRVSEAVE